MNINVHVSKINLKPSEMAEKIENDPKLWTFAATQWHRLYSPYVPMGDSGNLADDVEIRPKEIEHLQPYARRQYNGVGFHFRRDKHPKASAKWDRAARATQLPKLVSTMQAYIDSGNLKI